MGAPGVTGLVEDLRQFGHTVAFPRWSIRDERQMPSFQDTQFRPAGQRHEWCQGNLCGGCGAGGRCRRQQEREEREDDSHISQFTQTAALRQAEPARRSRFHGAAEKFRFAATRGACYKPRVARGRTTCGRDADNATWSLHAS
ncbi:MAG: hypothetical protein EBR23_13630 [Planctomycetia bacterium]|nr:hypothetical protein [Planctomycetia bacterium]